ncbi:RICIN domain-containing protein [Streptomyces sp. NPDC058268]|uniref:RICIN domain-containing protein n=1 Tax=Streptomyces sp. NPDC058268 TaxID=3346413 RepID=UPI0036E7AF0E
MNPDESDTSLAARLRGRSEGESDRPVALLLARHWQATYDYSTICLAARSGSASIVATASFHQVLGHLASGEPGGALRPYLLVTVRETVREWTVDDRISALMPELRKPTGGRGMRAATSMTPEKRRLAARSFWALPGVAQCLLWHTVVEAEHISIPAGLSGLSADRATVALEQAREQFRAGIVRGHRELAPTKECPLYNRILDVTIRRGGALLPDARQHLEGCRHCRDVADQLGCFERELGTLLAEAVLGWGARRYLESRPGRGGAPKRTAGSTGLGGRHSGGGGRHRPASHVAPRGGPFASARTHSGALRTGAALGAAALLATVLVITLSSGDDNSGATEPPTGMTGMTGSRDTPPGAGGETPSAGASAPTPTVTPTPTSAEYPGSSGQGRLRNAAADLCLDVRGKVKPGAEAKLAKCSTAGSQQWSYDENGLLSSVTRPELCLDSHRNDGVIVVGTCAAPSAARADEVRYDLTVLGELLPRWHERLAVAPASVRKGADVVVKVRDGSPKQRWMLDDSAASTAPKAGPTAGPTAGPGVGPHSRSIKGKSEPSLKPSSKPSLKGGPDAPRRDGHACTGSTTCEPLSPHEQRQRQRQKPGTEAGAGSGSVESRKTPDSPRRGEAAERYAEAGCCEMPSDVVSTPPTEGSW